MDIKLIISPQPKCKTCGKPMQEWEPFADNHEHVSCISDRISNELITIIKNQINFSLVNKQNMITEKQQAAIDDILDNFDFERVRNVMRYLDWTWADTEEGVPTISELRKTARQLLKDVIEKNFNEIGTGGFTATLERDNLRLQFVLYDWDITI